MAAFPLAISAELSSKIESAILLRSLSGQESIQDRDVYIPRTF